jgi:lactobin A/cerein 7B family class IIb bacteriocin
MDKFKELSFEEMQEVDGGFVPLLIWGVLWSAPQVAAAAGAFFLAGVAAGTAVAIAID